jgi:hypothetical protein
MSWDILIQDLPNVAGVEDIPDDFQPKPLGSLEDVVDRLRTAFPTADFSDSTWAILDQDDWSIEFNIGDNDPCESVMLHVRGGGTEAIDAVQRTIDVLGGRGLDLQGPGFFELDEARVSFAKWQAYRDQALVQYPDEPPKVGFFARLFGLN